jgi:hypothetical protein
MVIFYCSKFPLGSFNAQDLIWFPTSVCSSFINGNVNKDCVKHMSIGLNYELFDTKMALI